MEIIKPIPLRASEAPSYWLLGILWSILVDGEATNGRWSLMEQMMPQGGGPPPHVHPFNDEWFYVLEGEMTMVVGGQTIAATTGKSVWIPQGTVHSFRVTTGTCRVLNGFSPAGMEQVIKHLGKTAENQNLPPKDLQEDPKKLAAFANNYWGMEADVPFAKTSLARIGSASYLNSNGPAAYTAFSEGEVQELEQRWVQLYVKNDADSFADLLADNFLYTSPMCEVVERGAYLNNLRERTVVMDYAHASDTRIQLLGETAVVTASWNVKERYRGQEFAGPCRITRVWTKQGAKGRAVAFQVTECPRK